MGNGNIDWNPGNSPLWKGTVDWNPLNSTPGQAVRGNWGEAGRGAMGGIENAAALSGQLASAALNPTGAIDSLSQSISGETQAAQRRKRDLAGVDARDAQLASERAAADAQARQTAEANKRNQDYQSQQASMSAALGAEDAFTKARNAARKAKGTQLFGAF